MHWPFACIVLIQLSFLCQQVASTERLRIDRYNGHFVDSAGRVLILHGVNVVQKSFPWHPSLGGFDAKSSLNSEDMMNLKKWGFNVVRLGVMWPGVEPRMGEYNATYLGIMRQIIDDLYSHGIYTVVDLHQDSMSEQWCGEGLPHWMVPMLQPLLTSCDGVTASVARVIGQCKTFSSFNISTDPQTGFPTESGCLERTFDAYSRTPELVSAWGNFYENTTIQQKLHGFWSRVATEFSNSPGVLGYDLLNEPLNGNFFSDPHRIIPGYLDEHVLQPLYQSLHDVIVAADPQAIIMYEPPPFPDTYPAYIPWEHGVHPTGFTSGPARDRVEHQALSYHIYSCGFAIGYCPRSGDAPAHCPDCDKFAEAAVTTRAADAKRVGGGIFLTEFGACSGSEDCIAELRRVLGFADSAFQSWAYWQFKYNHDITTVSGPLEGFYTKDGSLQTAKVAALSRTFAPAIAGLPQKMSYEPRTGAFRLAYKVQEATAHLPTEIYLNRDLNYNSTAYITSCLNGQIQSNGTGFLYVTPSAAGVQVSVAVARPYEGAKTGTFQSKDKDLISWAVSDNETSPGFELSTAAHITYWKSLKVFADHGEMLCELSLQDANHGPARCDLRYTQQHDFLFSYRIELWKAKSFGRHQHVDTINFLTFGPLLGKRISFTWAADAFGFSVSNELLI
eukprot:TRINITY_DN14328_c0_g2_i1.p1 TRINITY_DN14328_c0_g2~~TRINITY_DN14328_c0_g2_i1.p1  ORF type:complete len:673 (-),score=85.83 TRINITY_DN14328_c0_g2_i1:149-2167(-)